MLCTALKIVLWDRVNMSCTEISKADSIKAVMENVINFAPFWYLSIRITNSTGIWAKWINCLLYKVLIIPVLNKNCTEPYFGPLHRSYIYIYIYIYLFILIKIIVQCSECKFPERVLLIGVISICIKKVFKDFTPVWN